MQVHLTEFEADNFPLTIQDNRGYAMMTDPVSVEVHPHSGSSATVRVKINSLARQDRRHGEKLFRQAGPVIGANTLSIIGQIEPGRTVRLYRQIH